MKKSTEAAAGENMPTTTTTTTGTAAGVEPALKKAKLVGAPSVVGGPSTPARVLGASALANHQPIAPAAPTLVSAMAAGKKTATMFKPVEKAPKAGARSAMASKAKPLSASTSLLAAPLLPPPSLDDSFMSYDGLPDAADVPCTPNGAKIVRFGGSETKFISPSPPASSSSSRHEQTSIIQAPANIENLRVKAKAGKTTTGMMGGAKRQAVKSAWQR